MMINIDQVRTLEQKVKQTVQLISNLKAENNFLRSKLADYEVRIQELETLLHSFKDSQTEIEAGIVHALEQLHQIEDTEVGSATLEDDPVELPPSAAPTVTVESPTTWAEPATSVNEEAEFAQEEASDEEAFEFDSRPAESQDSPLETSPDSHEEDQQQGLGIF